MTSTWIKKGLLSFGLGMVYYQSTWDNHYYLGYNNLLQRFTTIWVMFGYVKNLIPLGLNHYHLG